MQEIYHVCGRTLLVRECERLPIVRLERSKDITASSQAIVYLLMGSPTIGLRREHSSTRVALGTQRPHLIQTKHHRIGRRVGVQLDYDPLFSAKRGSALPSLPANLAYSENHRSCMRHLSPSLLSSTAIRSRLIGILRYSLMYAASRSSVQAPKGRGGSSFKVWLRICGSVRAVCMTSPPCSCVYVGGRPDLGSSSKPANPSWLKRSIQRRTVLSHSCTSCAILGNLHPSRLSHTIRALCTFCRGSVREWASLRSISVSAPLIWRTFSIGLIGLCAPPLLLLLLLLLLLIHLLYSHLQDAPLRMTVRGWALQTDSIL